MFKPISRRAMLQGTGAALALPWLEAMSPRASGAESLSRPPVRTAFLFVPNGVWPKSWTPEGKDEQYEITPLLEPLAEYLGDFQVGRDYRLQSDPRCQAAIYMQGFCQASHGLSDTLLSVLPVRAEEIANSLHQHIAAAQVTRGSALAAAF